MYGFDELGEDVLVSGSVSSSLKCAVTLLLLFIVMVVGDDAPDASPDQYANSHSASGDAELRFSVLNPDASEPMQVVEAKNAAGERLGYAALGEAQGYGGPIRVMVGMDPKAERLLGVAIVSQSETPGLGSRIAEVKSNKTWSRVLTGRGGGETEETTPEFLKQYLGRTLDELVLGKGIDGLTGATVSSTAVVEAARSAVKRIKAVVSAPAVSPASGKASGGEGAGK